MRKIWGTLITLVIIIAALPGAGYAQEQTCAEEYTILAGDTLSFADDDIKWWPSYLTVCSLAPRSP